MLSYYLYFSVVFCLTYAAGAEDQCNKNKEKSASLRIREHIFCDYDKTVRPVIDNNATALDVKLFVHHFDYEIHRGLLKVSAWVGMRWSDEHIHWDPEKFEGLETILADTDDLWTPDLSIYNRGSYGNSRLFRLTGDSCVIFYHKRVICVAQSTIMAMCTPDYRHYPFDIQNCTVKIGSWYHTGEEIDLADTDILAEIGSSHSQHDLNPEWSAVSLTFNKDPGVYKDFPNETYPSLNFVFVIKRNAAAKFAILMVPILVVIGLSVLTLWLEPISIDRIYILTINIPLHVMFLLNFQWDLPESGASTPYLVQLMRNSEIIVLITLVETVVVRYLLNKTKETPRFLVITFAALAGNKIGQLLLFSELNPENAAENLTADDSSNLVDVSDRPKEWFLLGKVVDRLLFLSSIIVYFVMLVLCMKTVF